MPGRTTMRVTKDVEKAVERLLKGQVVAIPTETVYGLAGDIFDTEALKQIFSLKKRPLFDPLIVHIPSIEKAKPLVQSWPEAADILAKRYWPGPLTLILPKSNKVDDLVTAGGETVGLRSPSHPLTMTLLELSGMPLAAPSANQFKSTSPTSADDVEEEFPDNDFLILDGGACEIGIESSVIEIHPASQQISVYRQGWITPKDIEATLNEARLSYEVSVKESPKAPGHLKDHYQPSSPLILIGEDEDPNQNEKIKDLMSQGYSEVYELGLPQDPDICARKLYSSLRNSSRPERILVYKKPKTREGDPQKWQAINDRLQKASTK